MRDTPVAIGPESQHSFRALHATRENWLYSAHSSSRFTVLGHESILRLADSEMVGRRCGLAYKGYKRHGFGFTLLVLRFV